MKWTLLAAGIYTVILLIMAERSERGHRTAHQEHYA